ncbi:MAG: hypothetical protein A4E61_00587 [Syntrophorhabdus sp. PtaB.Bin184]|jgi:hypothetical protein|nr:MAG: hypothetical protein A4E61_00587 [Syntrophorhabdus sp. PtaB.Bin184]
MAVSGKEKKEAAVPDGNEVLAIEVGIFRGLKLTSRSLLIIPVATVVLSIIMVVASIVIVVAGKGKDKIVFMDSTGRPSLVRVDDPDRIHWPELEIFCRDAIRDILCWTYVEVRSQGDLASRISRVSKRFDPVSFKAFYEPYRDNYLKSLSDQKLIVTAEWNALKDSKIRGREAVVLASVRLNAVRVVGEEAASEDLKVKTYEIKLYKGARSVENPFGLYIVRFSEPAGG